MEIGNRKSKLDLRLALTYLSDSKKRSVLFEHIGLWISASIFCFSVYTLVSETFWLYFIKEFNEGLTPLAKVISGKGTSLRKTIIDTLWLPTLVGSRIYYGDSIITRPSSNIEIEFRPGVKLNIGENSLVRIRMLEDNLLIYLAEGSVETEFSKDENITVKRGAVIEEVQVPKGNSIIKADASTGIYVSPYTPDREKIKPESEPEKPQPDTKKSEAIPDAEQYTPPTNEILYELPYPANSTVFLQKKPTEIAIAAMLVCPDICELKIYRDQKLIAEINTKKDETSVAKIPAEKTIVGQYEWTFITERSTHRSQFQIQIYSKEALFKAIEMNLPVEVQH